ncbi:Yip1 family protein [Dethiobacter alkaliphilus]|uniref:Yip1 family protein n=1 Tax=Dethiobacter alkaliphilus TaxID=427926 RepID=UPI0022266A37|nr:Yip1 family protein [Dethiobacter alkaliphilus]MCW3489909.1 YIP1 family protein [Dethiobacter alkaliphilus]
MFNFLTDILLIKGSIAENIKQKNSSLLSPCMVLFAAVLYGITSYYSGTFTDQLPVYLLFAYIYMVASQLGITLLLWAMCRLFGGTSRFMDVFIAVGYSFIPYGIMAAANAYYTPATTTGLVLILASVLYLMYLLTKVLHLLEGFSQTKATFGIIIGFIFVSSFIYIFGY